MADWSYTPPPRKSFDVSHDNALPPHWAKTRARQLRREPRCQFVDRGVRCSEPADDVDHIVPRFEGGTHDVSNLQSLCSYHHRQKTLDESHRAWDAAKKATLARFDFSEKHPLDL